MDSLFHEFVLRKIEKENFDLLSSQTNLCLPIIYRIYQKMKIGIRFPGIKIDHHLIIDGHHRYVASLLAGADVERYSTLRSNFTHEYNWKDVKLDFNDWDTPSASNPFLSRAVISKVMGPLDCCIVPFTTS